MLEKTEDSLLTIYAPGTVSDPALNWPENLHTTEKGTQIFNMWPTVVAQLLSHH